MSSPELETRPVENQNKTRIILISSLERSGSTIFDLALGQHPDLVSFGEVERVLLPHSGHGFEDLEGRKCTCGDDALECRFWSRVIEQIQVREADTLEDRYRVFLETVGQVFGRGTIPVDSSKTIRGMSAASVAASGQVSLLHITRDVRAWVLSNKMAARRKRELPWGRIFQPNFRPFWLSYLRHNILRVIPGFLYVEWTLRNLRLRRFSSTISPSPVFAGYDVMALDSKRAISSVLKKLELKEADLTQIDGAETHIIRGNRTAFETGSIFPLRYDFSWMARRPSLLLFLATPILLLNKKWVYGSSVKDTSE